ncbi:hypothetical protein ACFYVR_01480 [Rhodococcus sp. NPDC003318]
MEREGAARGLVTLCIGVGQGVSLAVEALRPEGAHGRAPVST